jgi:diketogulonate reductase-like aldo/keto reductase
MCHNKRSRILHCNGWNHKIYLTQVSRAMAYYCKEKPICVVVYLSICVRQTLWFDPLQCKICNVYCETHITIILQFDIISVIVVVLSCIGYAWHECNLSCYGIQVSRQEWTSTQQHTHWWMVQGHHTGVLWQMKNFNAGILFRDLWQTSGLLSSLCMS